MKIAVIGSYGSEFITDLGESVDAHSADGEVFHIPRFAIWKYRKDGKAECLYTNDNLDQLRVEWVNGAWEKTETK